MTSVVICTSGAVLRFSSQETRDCAWVYLGKDLRKRERVAGKLGEKGLLPLGDQLHDVAERLRQPFLDFIAELGRIQTDQLGWWSSSCSWKNAVRSDLFLLLCYQHLIQELVTEAEREKRNLMIVVEDPWLYRQLREVYAGSTSVRFCGTSFLWRTCVHAFVLGMGARFVWIWRLLINYVNQRWFWERSLHHITGSLAFYTYPQARCLRGAADWTDPYLGELDADLEEAGYSVFRFTPPEIGGFERAIAKRSRYFSPLILWVTPLSLFRSLLTTWRPIWTAAAHIEGLSVRWLLLREWWLDRWRSSYFLHRVFHEAVRRLLEAGRVRLVIYPFENQPWERMLVLAARLSGVSTIGYQHGGGLPRSFLPYFYGHGEAEWAPLPDLIMSSGSHSFEEMAEAGMQSERLVMGGSLRFQYLWKYAGTTSVPRARDRGRILVILPIYPDLVQHMIHAFKKAFPDGGFADGLEFVIKPHPMCPLTQDLLAWPTEVVSGTLEEIVQACKLVVYSGSTAGLEAVVMGRAVVRYRPELLLYEGRETFLEGLGIMDCGDHDLREKILWIHKADRVDIDHVVRQTLLTRLFPPADNRVWLQAADRFLSLSRCSCQTQGAWKPMASVQQTVPRRPVA